MSKYYTDNRISSKGRKVAVFDLDGTLINQNSTFDFVRFFLLRKNSTLRLIYFFTFWILEKLYLPKSIKRRKRMFILSLLKGRDRKDIEKCSKDYVNYVLPKVINREVFQFFLDLKNRGYYCILASASIDCVVKNFAEKFSFNRYISSSLAYDENNVCLGYLSHDILGKKLTELIRIRIYKDKGRREIDYKNSFCFTDSADDNDLLNKFGRSYIVTPSLDPDYLNNLRMGIGKSSNIKALLYHPALQINSNLFVIPGVYYFYSRISLKGFVVYHCGFLLLSLLLLRVPLSLINLFLLFLAWLGYISLYETGYLINDCISTRREKYPVLRVDKKVCGRINIFILTRLVTFFTVIFLLVRIGIPYKLLILYLLSNITILVVFLIHDLVPRTRRIFTYPVLKDSHLIVPLLIFPINFLLPIVSSLLFYIPREELYYIRKSFGHIMSTNDIVIMDVISLILIIFVFLFYIDTGNFVFLYLALSGFWLSIINFGSLILHNPIHRRYEPKSFSNNSNI